MKNLNKSKSLTYYKMTYEWTLYFIRILLFHITWLEAMKVWQEYRPILKGFFSLLCKWSKQMSGFVALLRSYKKKDKEVRGGLHGQWWSWGAMENVSHSRETGGKYLEVLELCVMSHITWCFCILPWISKLCCTKYWSLEIAVYLSL